MTDKVGTALDSRSVITFVSLMGLALLIYTPWQPVPFDILDFSELLPILRESDSFRESFHDVAAYYRGHGRSNPVTSAFIALNWELFGEAPLAWRLFRSAVMAVALAFTIRFLSRIGFSTSALVGGASIVVVALSAAGNWLRLTGEPIAFVCLILGLGIAAGYREHERWGRRLAVLVCLVIAMLLTKETMIALVPAVVGVASVADSRFVASRPVNRTRTRALWASLLGVSGLFAAWALWIAGRTEPGAYVDTYGRVAFDIVSLTAALQRIFLPMGDVREPLVWWNVLFALFVLSGCVLASLGPRRERARLLVALGAYLILAGAIVYLPWGRFEFFYGLPFSLGTVLLVAIATEELLSRADANRSLVLGGLIVALAMPATLSQVFAARTYALREINWEIAGELPRFAAVDSFVVAVEGLSAQPWQGRAATLRRVAAMLQPPADAPLPPAVDRECELAERLVNGAPFAALVLSYDPGCGPLPMPDRTYRRSYAYAKVLGFAAAHQELRAYLARPPVDTVSAPGSR